MTKSPFIQRDPFSCASLDFLPMSFLSLPAPRHCFSSEFLPPVLLLPDSSGFPREFKMRPELVLIYLCSLSQQLKWALSILSSGNPKLTPTVSEHLQVWRNFSSATFF